VANGCRGVQRDFRPLCAYRSTMAVQPPAQPLRDGAVELRPWRLEDAGFLAARIDGDSAMTEFLDQIPQPYTRENALTYLTSCEQSWATGENSNFAILVDGIEGAAGSIGVHWKGHIDDGVAEMGYWLAEPARGRGVTTAAARLAVAWAFEAEPRLQRLQLRAAVENRASNRVAEKTGFTREGVLRSAHWNARLERRVDWVMWSLLRSEVR
jgi:[ribosomal protein S5]-alanine N-acetyltransferase